MLKVYFVPEKSYDYFDYNNRYHGDKSKKFNTLSDAWAYYKSRKSSDYNYGDSFRTTYAPIAVWYAEKPDHNEHGQRFGHKPTIEEKLRRAVDDALAIWKDANKVYREVYDKFGHFHPKTNEARIYMEDLWAKVEEAEADRDEYLDGVVEQYDGGYPFDNDLLF